MCDYHMGACWVNVVFQELLYLGLSSLISLGCRFIHDDKLRIVKFVMDDCSADAQYLLLTS